MNISTNTPTACITNNTIDELLAKLLDILGFSNSSPIASNMSQPLTTPIALNTSGPVPYISVPVGYYPTQLAQPTYMTQQSTYVASTSWTPGGEVLRRLVSSNFISCNKEKPPVLFHALSLENKDVLSQRKYATEILEGAHMASCNSSRTPVDTESKLGDDGDLIFDPTLYRSLAGSLQYLTFTRLDISYAYLDSCPSTTGCQCCPVHVAFRHKYLADGTLSRYKARLVANGSTQLEGADVDENFSPVVKPGTIRTVLSFATFRHWPIHQLDVKNAFLHGDLSETVYMHQPPGFRDSTHPDYVCLRQRSLYGLKQAPHAWFQRFASYITRVGFHQSCCDSSLFIFHQGKDTAYLLLYVDDIVLKAFSSDLLHRIISSLHQEFAMTDLGSLNSFLGISVTRDSSGMFLSQKKYAVEILERAGMVNCNPSRTPVDTESKLGKTEDVVFDLTLYRSLAGSLQYLTFTRPDISYAVQQVCLHMHDPREPYFFAFKRILRYVCGTLDYDLQLFSSSTTDLVAYSDADWAGCPTTRRSTSEYRGVANAVAETCWLRNLLRELHTPLSSATLVYCGNVSVVYLSSNPIQHQRTKHIEIDIHFVRDLVATDQVRVLHVLSRYQFTDIFTKGLPTALFEEFRSSFECSVSSRSNCRGMLAIQFVIIHMISRIID
nr:ribonuclease H-like domain-containing protein [Tanacetum cinerariifolium]